MNRNGINVNRRLVGGNNYNVISPELEKLNTSTESANLYKAVVIDVVCDPDVLTEEEKEAIGQSVNNPELTDIMPFNSIVARIVSNGTGTTVNANTILFPFFQSHLQLPINPGEIVYVVYEDYKDLGNKIGYWFTRACGPKTIEDLNYTHLDRRFDQTMNPVNYSTLDKKDISESVIGPDFQNGGGTDETLTIPILKKGENPFDTVLKQSKVFNFITPEPVPRWKKRPGDFVIQGSNNSLISLGQDRVDSLDEPKKQSGTIDIVTGRGRNLPKTDSDEPLNNAPRVIKNSRGNLETDKAPYRRNINKKDNPSEGNPDFINDASRLYISMQTDADVNFSIGLNPNKSLNLPKLPTEGTFGKGFLVGKSDHIRMIARQDLENNVNGTILLIKEGQPNKNLGYFYIDDSGNIQIEGTNVYLGQSTAKTEPAVLFTNYKDTITSLQTQIDNLTSIIENAFAGAIGNLGAPIVSLSTVGGRKSITTTNTDLKNKVINLTKPNQHSLKIFNEPNK